MELLKSRIAADFDATRAGTVAVAGSVLGQQFYVSATGLDSNPGSQSAPWATIQHAAVVVAPGDTVHVAPGTYIAAVKTTTSGTSSARIRFVSDVQWGAHINTAGATTSWENDGDYVDILGFSVSGDGDIGVLNEGSNVRIIGNEVHDVPVTDCTENGGAGIDNANFLAQDDDIIANYVRRHRQPCSVSVREFRVFITLISPAISGITSQFETRRGEFELGTLRTP